MLALGQALELATFGIARMLCSLQLSVSLIDVKDHSSM